MSDQPEQPGQIRSAYLEERRLLLAGELEYAKTFDLWLITIAGAAIGLSLTLLDHREGGEQASCTLLLGGAWLALCASVLMILLNMLLSQAAHEEYREILDEEFEKGLEGYLARARARQDGVFVVKCIAVMNRVAAVSLILGLLLMLGFFWSNIRPSPVLSEGGRDAEAGSSCRCDVSQSPERDSTTPESTEADASEAIQSSPIVPEAD